MSTRSIGPDRYAERIRRAQERLPGEDAAALLIGVGADLQWLTGYGAQPLERLTMLIVPDQRQAQAGRAAVGAVGRRSMHRGRRRAGRSRLVAGDRGSVRRSWRACSTTATAGPRSRWAPWAARGVASAGCSSPIGLWATFLLRLQAAVPDAAFGLASTIVGPLRAVKDAEEIELLRRAAHAADRVVGQIGAGRLVGRTESDVAREVGERLVAEGHDVAAFAIVASGPNSASPHHEPGDREIRAGEPIVLDIGGSIDGYASDITRTLWVTGDDGTAPDADFARLYGVLQQAQAAGRAAVRPGIACEKIDAAARQAIDEGGFGEYFIHRTGHGIGLEVHEDPYLVAGNDAPMAVGNAFSVEPGIYLDGRYGARIEDIVVCAADGPDELNRRRAI